MYCFIFFSFALLNTHVSLSEDLDDPTPPETMIHQETPNESACRSVGGENCYLEKHPFMVSIMFARTFQHSCGGSLVAPRWVLTAAHCFDRSGNTPKAFLVVVGLSRIYRIKSQVLKVKSIIVHEEYDEPSSRNDIALVYIERNVDLYHIEIELARLPLGNLPNDLSTVCDRKSFTASAWGELKTIATSDQPPFEVKPRLKCIDVTYITNEECLKYSEQGANNKMICLLNSGGVKDACKGDLGGPLFCAGVQYGIMSRDRRNATTELSGFYTRVDKYLNFIQDTIKTAKSFGNEEEGELLWSIMWLICSIVIWLLY